MSLTLYSFQQKSKAVPNVLGTVNVPALGGSVSIRRLSAGGRDRAQYALFHGDKESYRARMVVETACDDNGKRLFTEDDMSWLSQLDYDILEPIVDESNKLNEYAATKDLEKNSSNPPTEGSPSV